MTSILARNDSKAGTTMTPISARRLGPKRVTPEDGAIGVRVRSLRMERGLSQTALADAMGVTFQQVQKYEKGSNRISGSRIGQIAAALEVPPSAILGTSEQQLEQSLGDKMTATAKGCRHAAAFIKLEGDAQEFLVNLAEWLLQVQERGK